MVPAAEVKIVPERTVVYVNLTFSIWVRIDGSKSTADRHAAGNRRLCGGDVRVARADNGVACAERTRAVGERLVRIWRSVRCGITRLRCVHRRRYARAAEARAAIACAPPTGTR